MSLIIRLNIAVRWVEQRETYRCQFRVDLIVVGILRMPSAVHAWVYTAHGVCLLLCIRIYRGKPLPQEDISLN